MIQPGEHRESSEVQVWNGHAPVPTWETPFVRVGRRGLDLVRALDDADPQALLRGSNVISRAGSPLQTRLGQTVLGTTAEGHQLHSLFRLHDSNAGAFARFVGSNTALYRGTTGSFSVVDTGYSGDPLQFTQVAMPLAGTPYLFIADRSRNQKISRTGAVEAIGLAPAVLTSTVVGSPREKVVALFNSGDNSEATNWTATAGRDRASTPNASGVPVVSDVMGGWIRVTTTVGSATTGYDNIVSIARTVNLEQYASGAEPAYNADFLTVHMNVSDPLLLEEVKIFLVVSSFTAGKIPGFDAENAIAWWKSFRPNDFTGFYSRQESATTASEQLRQQDLLEQYKRQQLAVRRQPSSAANFTGRIAIPRLNQPVFPGGRNVWGLFGRLGIPLRRGDWALVGSDPSGAAVDWSTITGIVIVIQTAAAAQIAVEFSQLKLEGGYGPDTFDATYTPYDYRVTHYNPVTGAEGNPSAVVAEASRVEPRRQFVTVTPTAHAESTMRQRVYRRGGSPQTTQNWFLVGQNSSNGGTVVDDLTDDAVLAAETLEIDNDQPVTSVNASGATVLAQRVTQFFQVGDYTFALGDVLKPGRLYRSKRGRPESWPATEYEDVCPPSEQLMAGGQTASGGYVFSRSRLYAILLNEVDGSWTTEPTECKEGLASPWAQCVTPFGIAFVSQFGLRLTRGAAPESLSDGWVAPLFRGQSAGGLAPINFAVPTALQLAYHDQQIWLSYQDTGGTRRQLVYDLLDKAFWSFSFGSPVAAAYSEDAAGGSSLLLGGNADGTLHTHSGTADGEDPIAFAFRTSAWHFNAPRQEKLLGEILLDADLQDASAVIVEPRLNDETVTVTPQTLDGVPGLRRYYLEPFGVTPQYARNVSVEIRGDAPLASRLAFNSLGITRQLLPEITYKLPTPWEELPGGEGYCYGVILTCDTAGLDKTVVIEYTVNNGPVLTAATLTFQASGRRKLPLSWPAVLAQQIRLRPTEDCEPWLRYKVEWLTDAEPPRLPDWNTNWESYGTLADKWLKGAIIEADTFGGPKRIRLDVDQTPDVLGLDLVFAGRSIQQVSFPKTRGRLFRWRSTDGVSGKLYRIQPIFDEEPLALHRWESQERPFPGMDGRWQKPLEAYVCLRSSAPVTWVVVSYGSGTTPLRTDTYVIPSTGGVKRKARVPLQAAKGLLFAHLFYDGGLGGEVGNGGSAWGESWGESWGDSWGEVGAAGEEDEPGPGFWLYREESEVLVEDFNTGGTRWVPLFLANDDLDPARVMGNAAVAAATPGGA